MVEERKVYKILDGKPEEREHLKDQGIDGRMGSEWNLERMAGEGCLCASIADKSDPHGGRWPSFGRYCAFVVTCPLQPISFSRLLCALSLSASHPHLYIPVTVVT
jgi:hypothetical protein